MQTISFYSYKGGTGRTLVVANVARQLARFGQKVVALDLDLEAPGLHYKFNLEHPEDPVTIQKGALDYIYEASVERSRPLRLGEKYAVEVPASASTKARIYLIPAGKVPSPEYWRRLAQINWHGLFYERGSAGVQLFLELKEQIREEFQPDFLLIDSRTGITEMGGVATAILPEKLVCLLLNNLENLEGARAVLRSLRREPRLQAVSPPEMVPVLSRIPLQEGSEQEGKLLDEVRCYLNEPAESLEETLEIPEVLVLHSEPELQVSEALRVGGSKSAEESVLLRDYLRLFLKIIPPDVILPHIGALTNQAKSLAFDDPDGAQRDLESLTQLGHPLAYRELLKFYRLRNAPPEKALRVAERLWEITKQSDDPLLWQTVKTHFAETYPPGARSPSAARKGDVGLLRFAEASWRAAGGKDVSVACDLAESYHNFGQHSRSLDVLQTLLETVGPNERAVVQYLGYLTAFNQPGEAKKVVARFRGALAESPTFLAMWARVASLVQDPQFSEELLRPPLSDRLSELAPAHLARLLNAAGRRQEAQSVMEPAFRKALEEGEMDNIMQLADAFREMGSHDHLREIVRSSASEEKANRILEYIEQRPRRPRW